MSSSLEFWVSWTCQQLSLCIYICFLCPFLGSFSSLIQVIQTQLGQTPLISCSLSSLQIKHRLHSFWGIPRLQRKSSHFHPGSKGWVTIGLALGIWPGSNWRAEKETGRGGLPFWKQKRKSQCHSRRKAFFLRSFCLASYEKNKSGNNRGIPWAQKKGRKKRMLTH